MILFHLQSNQFIKLVIDEDQIESWKKYFLNDEVYFFEFNFREDLKEMTLFYF